jgi:CxxC motif-containing protein (DUF1111 family)
MGITSPDGEADRVGGAPPPAGTDPAPDPETDQRTVDLLTDFVRFLAPPAPASPRSAEHADTLRIGERLFGRVGCPRCHTPRMRTARGDVPALSRKVVQLYSDLLLHDMGPGLANVCGYDASPGELRTAPLMGLGHRQFFLHDGRAFDLRAAIVAHDGEARAIRNAFARLPWIEQEYIVMFLKSL